MTEADYGPSFQIIAAAGDSKGYSMMAIKEAAKGNFEEAEKNMKQAAALLLDAHEFQTEMIQQEAAGNPVPVNIILVHSQDHLTMAMVAQDLSEQIVGLYKELHAVKKELQSLKNTAE